MVCFVPLPSLLSDLALAPALALAFDLAIASALLVFALTLALGFALALTPALALAPVPALTPALASNPLMQIRRSFVGQELQGSDDCGRIGRNVFLLLGGGGAGCLIHGGRDYLFILTYVYEHPNPVHMCINIFCI